jgi:hypothetical protein
MINRCALITALFLLALGAFSLHLRIHPVFVEDKHTHEAKEDHHHEATEEKTGASFNGTHFLAAFFSFVDLLLITALFCFKRSAIYAFLLNGMFCILGTILMGHFTMAQLWGTGASLADWLYLKSTLADIFVVGADFLLGKAVYESYNSG